MRHTKSLFTAGLTLLTGLAIPVFAQHDANDRAPDNGRHSGQQRGDHSRQDGSKRQRHPHGSQRNDQPTPRDAAPARTPGPSPRPGHDPGRGQRDWQRNRGWQHGEGWRGSRDWRGTRARDWNSEHRDWAQRGGYGGREIPRDRFEHRFGPDHDFRLHRRPILIGGYPRFYAGGFNFQIVDPLPEVWNENWYNDDDVYVSHDNGYYLNNRRHPGLSVAINVMF